MLIGLSGKSCTGKNLIGHILASYGAVHIDLDRINHEILEREIWKLSEIFGKKIINNLGNLDKAVLSEIVFSDKKKLLLLEEFVHPLIDLDVKKIINKENPDKIIIINGAVLHKSGLVKDMHGVIFSQSLLLIRLFRALKRDGVYPIKIIKRFWNQREIGPQLFSPDVDIYKVNNNWTRACLEKVLIDLFQKWSEKGEIYG